MFFGRNSPNLNTDKNLWYILKKLTNSTGVRSINDIIKQAFNILVRHSDLQEIRLTKVS